VELQVQERCSGHANAEALVAPLQLAPLHKELNNTRQQALTNDDHTSCCTLDPEPVLVSASLHEVPLSPYMCKILQLEVVHHSSE